MIKGKIGSFRSRGEYDSPVLCPRCQINLLPMGYPGALSRADNKTEICSQCGNDEAMGEYFDKYLAPVEAWPVIKKYKTLA